MNPEVIYRSRNFEWKSETHSFDYAFKYPLVYVKPLPIFRTDCFLTRTALHRPIHYTLHKYTKHIHITPEIHTSSMGVSTADKLIIMVLYSLSMQVKLAGGQALIQAECFSALNRIPPVQPRTSLVEQALAVLLVYQFLNYLAFWGDHFIAQKVHCYEGSLLRRFNIPTAHCYEFGECRVRNFY